MLGGCDSGSSASSKSVDYKTTSADTMNIKVSRTVTEAGKAVDFAVPDMSNIKAVEWRDKDGNLLSVESAINRLFTEEGEYEMILVLTDKNNKVTTETIVIKVTKASEQDPSNRLPVVKAKAESEEIMDGEYIHLSDDGSYDPDGTIVRYEWRDMYGILLTDSKKLDRVLYYDPHYDINHEGVAYYIETLYVTDDKGGVSFHRFIIKVNKKETPNQSPSVDAGSDRTITVGEDIALRASANDPDGRIVSYEWKEGSIVKGSSASLRVQNLSEGVHVFTVTVTDDKGATASDTVVVEVKPLPNHTPTAVSRHVSIYTNESKMIVLKGTDPDNDKLTYRIVTLPKHGKLTNGVPNTVYTTAYGYIGSDSFTFVVNDGKVDSAPATVYINVIANQNHIEQPLVTVAQAILGPLRNASFKIIKISNGNIVVKGVTTEGDGVHVSTAGLIRIPQNIKDSLDSGLYLIEVTGGFDVDTDDNNIWDAAPSENHGTLHAVMNGTALKEGDFKVNILTEVVYQTLKDSLGEKTEEEIKEEIANKAKVLLKDASEGGDVDGDGNIDGDDLIAWNPAQDKPKLAVDYNEQIKPVVQKVLSGENDTDDAKAVFNSAPVANAQNIIVKENGSAEIMLNASDPDGDTLSYIIVSQPSHGILSGTVPNLIYTPDKDYPGDDSFTYKVNDGLTDSATVRVSIDIKGYRLIKDAYLEMDWEITEYTYDTFARLIKELHYELYGGIKDFDYTFTYIYDENGRLTTKNYSYHEDGSIDSIYTYAYDSEGNIQSESYDYNVDGLIDSIMTYTYDANGNVVSTSLDKNMDGVADRIITYTYDSRGNVLSRSSDYDADGIIDDVDTYQYTYIYYDNGNLKKMIIDDDGYNIIKNYDQNGNLTEKGYSNPGDSEIDYDAPYHIYTWKEV
jgi:hypothetical protein